MLIVLDSSMLNYSSLRPCDETVLTAQFKVSVILHIAFFASATLTSHFMCSVVDGEMNETFLIHNSKNFC
jgi:hypothetical protein